MKALVVALVELPIVWVAGGRDMIWQAQNGGQVEERLQTFVERGEPAPFIGNRGTRGGFGHVSLGQ